ncbi:hypothetical protein CDL15_Pgr012222 [Punica granatum]|nr:hypothetical protein CDL15_Pgr012222 [Punica granatum]
MNAAVVVVTYRRILHHIPAVVCMHHVAMGNTEAPDWASTNYIPLFRGSWARHKRRKLPSKFPPYCRSEMALEAIIFSFFIDQILRYAIWDVKTSGAVEI